MNIVTPDGVVLALLGLIVVAGAVMVVANQGPGHGRLVRGGFLVIVAVFLGLLALYVTARLEASWPDPARPAGAPCRRRPDQQRHHHQRAAVAVACSASLLRGHWSASHFKAGESRPLSKYARAAETASSCVTIQRAGRSTAWPPITTSIVPVVSGFDRAT